MEHAFRIPSLSSMALMLLCWIAPAAADPITAVYDVEVTERMTQDTNPEWLPFDREFTLLLTFDPDLRVGSQDYGPPEFSPVPLPGIDPPAGLPLSNTGYTAHGQFDENPFGAANLFAVATVQALGLSADWYYFTHARLITNVPTSDPPPPFTADTFPYHLVLGTPVNFDFGVSLFRLRPSLQVIGQVQYQGFATLREVGPVAPIPEPATLALVGGGLVLAVRSGRRLKRTSGPHV